MTQYDARKRDAWLVHRVKEMGGSVNKLVKIAFPPAEAGDFGYSNGDWIMDN